MVAKIGVIHEVSQALKKRREKILIISIKTTASAILITSNFHVMLGVGLCLGMGKGIRSVYMNLVVPAYVSIDKVASALALQNLGVGVINLLISPLLGFLKDIHGSYSVSVIVLNMATLMVIVVLLAESVLNRRKKNVRSKPGSSHSQ
uniref:Major facilitator superfamily (MFS) profile domain-containing protein n=1 Tax=Timema monikensis TaxID=170555 RepID=A0A7R9EKA3_9NEOP|nr:unnamed protein product [Timema monikensis]